MGNHKRAPMLRGVWICPLEVGNSWIRSCLKSFDERAKMSRSEQKAERSQHMFAQFSVPGTVHPIGEGQFDRIGGITREEVLHLRSKCCVINLKIEFVVDDR